MKDHLSPPPLEEKSLLDRVLQDDAIAAVLLLLSALGALIVANTGLEHFYHWLMELELGLDLGGKIIAKPLHLWVNDGLMSIFFFVVGLEIKREVLVGELASPRKAVLPIVAAIGGMLMPAVVFSIFNYGHDSAVGWGIPMATDIAFAAGCLALLGRHRIPPSLVVFLVALAIVDDLGSVLVIAVFYSDAINTAPLALGVALIAISVILNQLGVRHALPYVVIGILLWTAFLQSGVHATIAGVLLAFTIPPNARYETPLFHGRMTTLLERFTQAEDFKNALLVNSRQQQLIRAMENETHHVEAPLQRIEHNLYPYSVFFIMPVFAFVNSGVTFELHGLLGELVKPVTLGVFFGLVLGKQMGIMLFSWIVVKLGLASLPDNVRWAHLYGVSWLAGIGFTMALFIDELAFPANGSRMQTDFLNEGKLGVFLASMTAGLVGYLILRRIGRVAPVQFRG